MPEKTLYINSDFLPSKAERFCLLPETAVKKGFNNLCIRMIDNFPWSFECRMKSDTAYDEKVLDYLARKCGETGLGLQFVFPGADDFSRLLRLNGYRRFACSEKGVIRINIDAVGFSGLIESVEEDFSSLCSTISSYVFEDCNPTDKYYPRVRAILEKAGSRIKLLECECQFQSAAQFLGGSVSGPDTVYLQLDDAERAYSEKAYRLKQFLIKSSLRSSPPAANKTNINDMYLDLIDSRRNIETALIFFQQSVDGLLDADWLEMFSAAAILTADEELLNIQLRMRQSGLLN